MTVPERPDDVQHPDPLLADGFDAASDAELIRLVRAGDAAAYEHLFLRHRDVAFRYARRISDSERAEDLCAEAFTKILDLLQRGKGPDVAFRAYLLTTVRTSHLNTIRAGSREELVPDHEPIARMVPHHDDPDARFDASAICRAFNSLPERWQAALWLTSVEGLSNEEASKHLGVKVNAVASLSFRARAGLRQAYLSEHLQDVRDPQCRRIIELLPSYLRDSLTPRRRTTVDQHLSTCTACTTAALEVSEVNGRLGVLLAPLALTGFAAAGATVVPVSATSVAGVVMGALSHAGTSTLGAIKGMAATTALQVKSTGSALSGLIGSKVAVAATVTVIGVAVGAEVVQHNPEPPAGERLDAGSLPVIEQRAPRGTPVPSASPAPSSPAPAPRVGAPDPGPTLAPQPQVLPPTPSAAPLPAGPSAPPTTPPPSSPPPSAPPTATPAPVAPRMALAQPTSTSYTSNGVRREQVVLPVLNPVPDTFLSITVTRTLNTAPAATTGTGWVCGTPVTQWFDGGFYATSTMSCAYTGNGDGEPLEFDYQVAAGSVFTAALEAPSGSATPISDALRQLLLR